VVFVVGAAVSLASAAPTHCLSWEGLLNHGHKHCEEQQLLDADSLSQLRFHLNAKDFITAGEILQTGLTPEQFSSWICLVFHDIQVTSPRLPVLISSFNCRIITTNYDGVLSRADPRRSHFTLDEADRLVQFMREDKHLPIFHLHGHYSTPSSIVLGSTKYDEIKSNPIASAVRSALGISSTFFFVGFGSGLKDPHFTTLLNTLRTLWGHDFTASQHFELVRGQAASSEKAHESGQPRQISYGHSRDDFLPWFELLRKRVDHIRVLCDVQN